MRPMGTGSTLTRAGQTVVNLDYDASSGNQAEKGISRIGQTNESMVHVLVCMYFIIEQEIRRQHDKRQKLQKMTIRKGRNSISVGWWLAGKSCYQVSKGLRWWLGIIPVPMQNSFRSRYAM